jgi:hypothetical protein
MFESAIANLLRRLNERPQASRLGEAFTPGTRRNLSRPQILYFLPHSSIFLFKSAFGGYDAG